MDYPVEMLMDDDDNSINQLLGRIIKKKSCFAKPANSKTEASHYQEKQDYDRLFIDLMLLPIDGEEIIKRINDKSLVPVIIISSKLEQQTQNNVLRHKDICVDTEARTVTVNGKELTLTAREYAIIVLLFSNPTKVFSKANLFESVWSEEYRGDDNTINVHISNIRNKLSKANPNEKYIQTIWGMGYRIAK